ncbi:MAG: hypothetical protein QG622_29 [Actinomycetota bacterium]|nr:hypothetical protein [Actinomycetota bacterium]
MFTFILALLVIFMIALAVVAAFAWPQLRAGAPILTSRGDHVAGEVARRMRPVTNVLRTATRPVTRPLGQALRPWISPPDHTISRAAPEGGGQVPPRLPGAPGPVTGQRDGRATRDELPVR